MFIYMTEDFSKWVQKEKLDERILCQTVFEMQKGLVGINLGGGLYKKRVARPGSGKSGGYRTLIATNQGDRWFFLYRFSKNERANITHKEEEALKKLSKDLLSRTEKLLQKTEEDGVLIRIGCEVSVEPVEETNEEETTDNGEKIPDS